METWDDKAVLHGGYLEKESRTNSNWNRRYFLLEANELRYFKTDPSQGEPLAFEDRKCRGEIRLKRVIEVCATVVRDRKFCLTLVMKSGPSINLAAGSYKDQDTWLNHLNEIVKDTTCSVGMRHCVSVTSLSCYDGQKPTQSYQTKIVAGVIMRTPCSVSQDDSLENSDSATCSESELRSSRSLVTLPVPGSCILRSASVMSFQWRDCGQMIRVGYLKKQRQRLKHIWQRRFFVLDTKVLAMFHSPRDKFPIKTIPLSLIIASGKSKFDQVREDEESSFFSVVTRDRVYNLQADMWHEAHDWVDAILKAVNKKPGSVSSDESTSENGSGNRMSVSRCRDSRSESALIDISAPEQRNLRMFAASSENNLQQCGTREKGDYLNCGAVPSGPCNSSASSAEEDTIP